MRPSRIGPPPAVHRTRRNRGQAQQGVGGRWCHIATATPHRWNRTLQTEQQFPPSHRPVCWSLSLIRFLGEFQLLRLISTTGFQEDLEDENGNTQV